MNLDEKKIILLKNLAYPLSLDWLSKLIYEKDENKFDELVAEYLKKLEEQENKSHKPTSCEDYDSDFENDNKECCDEKHCNNELPKDYIFEEKIINIIGLYPSHWKCKNISVEDNKFTFTYYCDGIVHKDLYEYRDGDLVYIGSEYAAAKNSEEILQILIPLVDKVKNESTVKLLNSMIRMHIYSL